VLLLLVVVFAFAIGLPATAAVAFSIVTRQERKLQQRAAELKLQHAEIALAYEREKFDEYQYQKAIGK
jgi:hypothetical protein